MKLIASIALWLLCALIALIILSKRKIGLDGFGRHYYLIKRAYMPYDPAKNFAFVYRNGTHDA